MRTSPVSMAIWAVRTSARPRSWSARLMPGSCRSGFVTASSASFGSGGFPSSGPASQIFHGPPASPRMESLGTAHFHSAALEVCAAVNDNFAMILPFLLFLVLQGSESRLRRAVSENPQEAQGYLDLSRFLEQQGKIPQAIEVLHQGLSKLPQSAAIRQEIGALYAAQKQFGKAAEQFESALKLNPSSADLRHNLAAARLQQ